MAKCVGIIEHWGQDHLNRPEPHTINDAREYNESSLSLKIAHLEDLSHDISVHFLMIKQSTSSDGERWDCGQAQANMNCKLNKLRSEILSVMNNISTSTTLGQLNKHRYFVLFCEGIVTKLKNLLQMVGRLSELDERIYYEEYCKAFVTEESIAIHSLCTIWSGAIEIMSKVKEFAKQVFPSDPETSDQITIPIENMEFCNAAQKYGAILLMDLIASSWTKFNMSAKTDDLIAGKAFICPCNTRLFFRMLHVICPDHLGDKGNTLRDLLYLVFDRRAEASYSTTSIKQMDVITSEPFFSCSDPQDLGYFVAWLIYSLMKTQMDAGESHTAVEGCRELQSKCLQKALLKYAEILHDLPNRKLSPHQEDRLRLILLIVDHHCGSHEEASFEKRLDMIRTLYEAGVTPEGLSLSKLSGTVAHCNSAK